MTESTLAVAIVVVAALAATLFGGMPYAGAHYDIYCFEGEDPDTNLVGGMDIGDERLHEIDEDEALELCKDEFGDGVSAVEVAGERADAGGRND